MFEALRFRPFRYLWAGLVAVAIGDSLQFFALGILVVRIAHRDGVPELAPLYIGLVGLVEAVPGVLLTIVAGAAADRTDRRRVLLVTHSTMALTSAALALIVYAGAESLPVVLAASAALSVAYAFANPSRQSLLPRLVPRAALPSAIGLQSATWNMSSFVGPSLAGVLFGPLGLAGLIGICAFTASFFVGAISRLPSFPPTVEGTAPRLLASILEGIRYIRRDPVLVWTIVLGGTVFAMVGPTSALMPALTGEARWNGLSLLSVTLAVLGLGALFGSFVTMNAGAIQLLGRAQAFFAMLCGGALVLFALAPTLPLALGCLFFVGLGSVAASGMGNNILQASADDAYRGRVISAWAFLFIGLLPVGQFVLGTLGSALGVRQALAVGGSIVLAAGIYLWSRVRSHSEWRTHAVMRTRVAS